MDIDGGRRHSWFLFCCWETCSEEVRERVLSWYDATSLAHTTQFHTLFPVSAASQLLSICPS